MSGLLEEAHEPPLAKPSHPPDFHPIQTWQIRREIVGVETEVLVQTFDDRILVIVTQSGKIGSLVQASLPPVAQLPHPPRPESPSEWDNPERVTLPPPPDAISTTSLLGTPPSPTLYALYTNQIATLIWWTLQETSSPRRPVVVGLALARQSTHSEDDQVDENERGRFLAVMDMITTWSGPKSDDF